jgi:hypothetical protein
MFVTPSTATSSMRSPAFHKLLRLTEGWEVNSFVTFYTGSPLTPKLGGNNSGVGEFQDRATLISNPNKAVAASNAIPAVRASYSGSIRRPMSPPQPVPLARRLADRSMGRASRLWMLRLVKSTQLYEA